MAANASMQILDELLGTLETKVNANASSATVRPSTNAGDAIQTALADEPRHTAVTSLRNGPVVEAFRQALSDGLIRVDTANRLLQLINQIIVRFVP